MFSLKARIILGGALVLLAGQMSCKGPYSYETHPVIWVNVSELSFSASEFGPNPGSKVIQIKNAGIQVLSYALSSNSAWIKVNPSTGSSSGQLIEHVISIEKAGLTSRTEPYTAAISITSAQACNSPQQVAVSLQLSTEPPTEISVSPAALTFAASAGGPSPGAQTLRVRNSGQGTLSYTLSDDSNWLEVSPASGSSSGNEVSHSVSVNSTGLGTGTYSGAITISDPNALNNPKIVSVTLTIGATIPPAISVTPAELRFNATVGGSNPSVQRIRVRNSGQGTLSYAVTDNAAWLNVSPPDGTSTGQEVSHNVSVNTGGLGQGSYEGLITVSSPNATNSPQAVRVTLVMGSIPTNNQISISCSPTSGGTGAVIDFPISILGNTQEITAIGLDVTFDTTMFEFVGVNRGALTTSWAQISGAAITGGVRIGGFVGDPTYSIKPGSSGTILVLRLRVTCGACSDGRQNQVCMTNFTEPSMQGMTLSPGCTTFTFRK